MDYENYDPYFPDQPVVDLYLPIWANLPAFSSKPAFLWVDDHDRDNDISPKSTSTISYKQLNDSVQFISSKLQVLLKRGDAVVILCSPGLDLVEVIFGCQRAGILSVPVFPPDPCFGNGNYHHLVRVLSQAKPKAAIAERGYVTRVKQYIASSRNKKLAEMLENLKWICTDDIKGEFIEDFISSDFPFYNGCKESEVYLIQYTSGATGIPKPVLVTAGSAAHNVRMARKAYDLHPNSVILSWLPQYHDCGLMFLLLTIVSGATCYLTSPNSFVTRPRLWLELITEFKATCTPVPSFALPLVVKRGGVEKGGSPVNLWSLRNLIIINEPIYKADVDEFTDVFKHFGFNSSSIAPSYGLAENCTFVSTSWRNNNDSASVSVLHFPCHNQLLPSARLSSSHEEGISIIVVNEETYELVEDGIEGEILISSPSNASGYLAHPSLTLEVFQRRLRHNLDNNSFVRTGDRGIIKGKERFLFVTGRCSDIIKLSNNETIHPHYIETAAYKSCPKFLRGGCVAAFMVSLSRTIVLVAEMSRSDELEERVLRNVCEGIRNVVLDKVKVELGVVVLVRNGNVPKTTSGKVQRWVAERKFVEGRMDVVMEVRFVGGNGFFSSVGAMVYGRKVASGGTEEVVSSLSSYSSGRPVLLSLL